MTNRTKYYVGSLLFLLAALVPTAAIHAQNESAISQDFETTTTNISTGTLLSLVSTGQNTVQPANTSNARDLVGIVGSEPLVELSGSNRHNVRVVVSGFAQALVSNINGNVEVGDKITASPVSGIGMKATTPAEVVGTAQENFAAIHTTKQTVVQQNGKTATINVGLMPIEVNTTYYSAPQAQQGISSILPPALQRLANAISGQQVSSLRIFVSILALILGFAAASIMLYASVRSRIVSIGRNPLAQEALRRGFIDVALVAVGIMAVSIAATYVILVS